MVMAMMTVNRSVLHVLRKGREVLLRRGKIAGLQIGSELVEGLGDGVGLRGRAGIGLRSQLLQSGKIGLRRRQISRCQVLAQLLEFPPELLHLILDALRVEVEKTAAGKARY